MSVTPATVPGAPTGLSATAGDQEVDLSWTAPASNGGAAITNYEYEPNGSGAWTSTGGTATNYTVRNLTNGQPYTCKVRAVNRVGTSTASAASPSVTPATEPDAPTASCDAAPRKGARPPGMALVHDSELTVNDPNPEASHRPILYDSGRPSSVIWFRTLHATTDSATRPPRDRARSRSPIIDLYRKNAFSTRAWRW